MKSEAELWRDEQDAVQRKRPWLAFSRAEPIQPKPAQPEHFCWLSVSDLIPIAEEGQ